MEYSEWEPPKIARRIIGYEKQNFYKTLKTVNKDGSTPFRYRVKKTEDPLVPIMYEIHVPSLRYFLKADIYRMKIEQKYWSERIKHQELYLAKLERQFGRCENQDHK